jgi:DNA-binding NarL/FixJ family response regulator
MRAMRPRRTQVAATVRPRVVVADDDEVLRTVLVAQLSDDFECVGVAADAPEGIALAAAQHPDVVILDVNMPGGGAARATREIREISPETALVIL